MSKERRQDRPVPVTDKRRGGEEAPAGRHPAARVGPKAVTGLQPSGDETSARPEDGTVEGAGEGEVGKPPETSPSEDASAPPHDYLNDLRRLQAEFDNYRKRMLREQTAMARRAAARLIERLLPVLDNFDAAISHGQGGTGIELVFKELKSVLESEGLEEIAAEGAPFDPAVHDAVETRESPDATELVVGQVYRRGYKLDGRVLRPAMVAVLRPAEPSDDPGEKDSGMQEAK